MAAIVKFLRKFRHAGRGATAIEYGFLAALIAIAMITAMAMLGDSLNTLFGGLSSEVDQAKAIIRTINSRFRTQRHENRQRKMISLDCIPFDRRWFWWQQARKGAIHHSG